MDESGTGRTTDPNLFIFWLFFTIARNSRWLGPGPGKGYRGFRKNFETARALAVSETATCLQHPFVQNDVPPGICLSDFLGARTSMLRTVFIVSSTRAKHPFRNSEFPIQANTESRSPIHFLGSSGSRELPPLIWFLRKFTVFLEMRSVREEFLCADSDNSIVSRRVQPKGKKLPINTIVAAIIGIGTRRSCR